MFALEYMAAPRSPMWVCFLSNFSEMSPKSGARAGKGRQLWRAAACTSTSEDGLDAVEAGRRGEGEPACGEEGQASHSVIGQGIAAQAPAVPRALPSVQRARTGGGRVPGLAQGRRPAGGVRYGVARLLPQGSVEFGSHGPPAARIHRPTRWLGRRPLQASLDLPRREGEMQIEVRARIPSPLSLSLSPPSSPTMSSDLRCFFAYFWTSAAEMEGSTCASCCTYTTRASHRAWRRSWRARRSRSTA